MMAEEEFEGRKKGSNGGLNELALTLILNLTLSLPSIGQCQVYYSDLTARESINNNARARRTTQLFRLN